MRTLPPPPPYFAMYMQIRGLQRSSVYVWLIKDLARKTGFKNGASERCDSFDYLLSITCEPSQLNHMHLVQQPQLARGRPLQVFSASQTILHFHYSTSQKLHYNAVSQRNGLPTCIIMHVGHHKCNNLKHLAVCGSPQPILNHLQATI
jgi:hypothetical protein